MRRASPRKEIDAIHQEESKKSRASNAAHRCCFFTPHLLIILVGEMIDLSWVLLG